MKPNVTKLGAFHEEWPALERRLRAVLSRRGIPHHRVDDVVQETSIRLFRMWHRVDRDVDAFPLVRVIASRAACDEARRSREVLDPDLLAGDVDRSAEAAAIAKLEVEEVMSMIERLSPAERRAVLAEIGEAERATGATSAFKTARMRGRRNLRLLLEKGAFGVAALGSALRRLARRPARHADLAQYTPAMAQAMPALVAMMVGLGAVAAPSGGAEPKAEIRATSARRDHDAARPRGVVPNEPARNVTPRRRSLPVPAPRDAAGDSEDRQDVSGVGAGAAGAGVRVARDDEGTYVLACVSAIDGDPETDDCDDPEENAPIVFVGDPHYVPAPSIEPEGDLP